MKTILTTLFLTICIMVVGQDTSSVKKQTLLYVHRDYSNLISNDTGRQLFVKDYQRYFRVVDSAYNEWARIPPNSDTLFISDRVFNMNGFRVRYIKIGNQVIKLKQ